MEGSIAAGISRREAFELPGVDAAGMFLFLLAVSYLPAAGLTLASALVLALYLLKKRFMVRRQLFGLLIIPSALVAFGVFGLFRHPLYEALKDGWYFTNPVLLLAAGFALWDWGMGARRTLRVFLAAAVAVSAVHAAYMLAFAGHDLLTMPVDLIRMKYGRGSFFPVVGALIAYACIRRGVRLFGRGLAFEYVSLAVCAAALVLTFSRTFWICLLVLVLVDAFDFRRPVRAALVLAGSVAALSAVFILLSMHQDTRRTFLGKTAQSLTEVAPSSYTGQKEIAKHWRGYETFMTLMTIASGDGKDIALGHGFGKSVDLGLYIDLGGEEMRYVSRVHNGYLYVMLKEGLAGLALYLLFLAWVIRKGFGAAREPGPGGMLARALSGIGLVLVLASFVNGGLYNKYGMATSVVFLGALYASVSCRVGYYSREVS
ncbi:MAG: O-antigen ligase family protein [Nitrospirae bacterium]|nr:O-antigen ligase family protein [Nitrospirota bacterium]